MIYVYAAVFTLAVTAGVLLVPLWVRGGGPAIRAQSGWLAPLALVVVASIALLTLAMERGFGGYATLVMGTLSVGLAAALITRPPTRRPRSNWYRAVIVGVARDLARCRRRHYEHTGAEVVACGEREDRVSSQCSRWQGDDPQRTSGRYGDVPLRQAGRGRWSARPSASTQRNEHSRAGSMADHALRADRRRLPRHAGPSGRRADPWV